MDLKKEKKGFLSFLILYMRGSVCTLFFHEDETHLFLYIMHRWGRVVLNFISKKGERKQQDRFNHSGEFLFSFSWKYHHLYVFKKDIEKRFFYRWIELSSSVLDTSPNGVVSLSVVAAAALCALNYSGLGRERSAFG